MRDARSQLEYRHLDVFAERPYTGNGLIVFFGGIEHSERELLSITAEMKQFESIFLGDLAGGDTLRARIFTVDEELSFAGHPIVGAAVAAHERWAEDEEERSWTFAIGDREIEVRSRRRGGRCRAMMNQGCATIRPPLDAGVAAEFLAALSLQAEDRVDLPLQVISTGLPYLMVPVTAKGLASARIASNDFGERLEAVAAKFVYVFDPAAREGRTWDNAGAVEDVATGSAAGPAAAYLLEHGLIRDSAFALAQGRFVDRPSSMLVEVTANSDIWIGGPVASVATGTLELGPNVGSPRPAPGPS